MVCVDGQVEVSIISAGRTPSLPPVGCFPYAQPTLRPVSPLGGKTTDWRAVCGRSARTVRRGEGPGIQPVLPTSIPVSLPVMKPLIDVQRLGMSIT